VTLLWYRWMRWRRAALKICASLLQLHVCSSSSRIPPWPTSHRQSPSLYPLLRLSQPRHRHRRRRRSVSDSLPSDLTRRLASFRRHLPAIVAVQAAAVLWIFQWYDSLRAVLVVVADLYDAGCPTKPPRFLCQPVTFCSQWDKIRPVSLFSTVSCAHQFQLMITIRTGWGAL